MTRKEIEDYIKTLPFAEIELIHADMELFIRETKARLHKAVLVKGWEMANMLADRIIPLGTRDGKEVEIMIALKQLLKENGYKERELCEVFKRNTSTMWMWKRDFGRGKTKEYYKAIKQYVSE